jgi:uncharacterized SAM-binding protein YcdF (DUF218 family)
VFKDFTVRRKILIIALMVLGAGSVIYSLGTRFYGVTFSTFFMLAGIVLIAASIVTVFVKEKHINRIPKPFLIASKIVFIGVLTSFLVIEGLIIYHGSKKNSAEVDYLVVLGAGLWGETPSLTLRQRLEESHEFIKENPETKVIVSGGMGPGETITEAEAMKRYLVQHGVDEKLIIKEDKSTNTKENLKFTRELLRGIDERDNIKIKIITTNFHMFRSKLLAKSNGFQVYGRPAPIHPLLIPTYYIREYMAVIKTFIFDLI